MFTATEIVGRMRAAGWTVESGTTQGKYGLWFSGYRRDSTANRGEGVTRVEAALNLARKVCVQALPPPP
jgi:hypothetical protein